MSNIFRMHMFDKPGALDQITGLIRRNGVNIQTIASGNVTGGTAQVTISLSLDDGQVNLDALGDRLRELACVRHWEKCASGSHIIRELLLVCFKVDQKHLLEDGMRIIREEGGMTFAEYVAEPSVIDGVFKKLCAHNVFCARGGVMSFPLQC
jgi:acetolactate synthase small subunit